MTGALQLDSSKFVSGIMKIFLIGHNGLLKTNNFLLRMAGAILGGIGLLIIVPIVFVFAIIGWFLMLAVNFRLERDRDAFNTLVNAWNDRKKMEKLIELERMVRKVSGMIATADAKRFIINPVTKQSVILLENLQYMEQTLKQATYPDLNEVMSEDDKQYLADLFKDSKCVDWKDPEVKSYDL